MTFFPFRSPFGNNFVTFLTFLVTFFAYPLVPPPFCGSVSFASDSASQNFGPDAVHLPSAPWAHESQRFVVTRIPAWNCPRLGTFKTNSLIPTMRNWGKDTGLCFARFVVLTFRGPFASQDSNPCPNRSRIARYNATKSFFRAFILGKCLVQSGCERESVVPSRSKKQNGRRQKLIT